jgi:hypothetical protein
MPDGFISGVACSVVAIAVIFYGLPAVLLSEGFCRLMQERADRAVREAGAARGARTAMLACRENSATGTGISNTSRRAAPERPFRAIARRPVRLRIQKAASDAS